MSELVKVTFVLARQDVPITYITKGVPTVGKAANLYVSEVIDGAGLTINMDHVSYVVVEEYER